MNRIIFSKQAENSLNDAFSFYESKQPDLGYNFIVAVENCLEKIISNPRLYPCKKFDFREALLKDYPFLVIYQIRGNSIRVLDVFHTSQHPDKKP